VDKGILYTIIELFKRPGHTIRDYIDGKRINHFKPVAFAFILSTIYLLLTYNSNARTYIDDFYAGWGDAARDAGNKSESIIFLWLKSHYTYSTIIFLPLLAAASFLAFNVFKYNFFQHFVLHAYLTGQRSILDIILFPVILCVPGETTEDVIEWLKLGVGIILTFWTYLQFFDEGSWIKVIKLTLLYYFILLIFFGIAFFLILSLEYLAT
jgi:hypothetical protein